MEQKVEEKIISFSLSEYVPEVSPPVEEVKEKTIEPEPIEPEPVEKEEKVEPVVEETVPEPEVVKELPKPIVKKIVKAKKKTIQKKRIKKKYHKTRVSKKKVSKKRKTKKVTQKKVSSSRKFSAAKKNAFLSQIRTRINKNKTYPRIAQRRGMQGSVHVSFVIKASGNVGNISVKGTKVFHTSARNAVKRAFPINVKNVPLSLPTTVNLTLRYQIR
ncbi:MAG TPA: energy transducer TonB [Epsilonproteobacteria bacterium]|nr:energy transducer TonB [Campylobacterota bacterium]